MEALAMDDCRYLYLVPLENCYLAQLDMTAPSKDAVKLTAEGQYPVELTYCRYDLNGSDVTEAVTCDDAKDLLRIIDWIGAVNALVLQVWDFQYPRDTSEDLQSIYADACHRRCLAAQKEV